MELLGANLQLLAMALEQMARALDDLRLRVARLERHLERGTQRPALQLVARSATQDRPPRSRTSGGDSSRPHFTALK